MNLLIDIGNTRTKFRLFCDHAGLSDELPFEAVIDYPKMFNRLVVSKVADFNLNGALQQIKYEQLTNVNVKPNAFGIECGYSNIKNLGVDRWIAVIGAQHLFPEQNVMIVDAGTATTIDFLTAHNKHLGGWIVPGFELMQSSIANKAPNVFSGDIHCKEVIGTDTPSALFNGCLYAQQGLIQQGYTYFKQRMNNEKVTVVITGGSADTVTENLAMNHIIEPDLLFHGLSRFCDK